MSDTESKPAAERFAAWLQRRLDELPAGASLTITLRRDRSGRLLRAYEVREGRVLTRDEIRAQT